MHDYFVISLTEGGIYIKKIPFHKIEEYLSEYYSDTPVEFLDEIPDDIDNLLGIIIIKGKLVVPKGVEIIKSFEVE